MPTMQRLREVVRMFMLIVTTTIFKPGTKSPRGDVASVSTTTINGFETPHLANAALEALFIDVPQIHRSAVVVQYAAPKSTG